MTSPEFDVVAIGNAIVDVLAQATDIVFLDGTRQTAFAAGFPDRQQGYVTLNLGIGYTIDNFRIEAWASNFLNEEVSQKALVGSSLNIRFLNDARTYGLRVRVNF